MGAIGSSPSRPDGAAKAGGTAVYADDFVLPGMLYGATLRSPHPHARIVRREWRPDHGPRDSIYVGPEDLPGPNGVLLIDDTWPILADGEVSHVGQAVALVAAPTRLDACRALAAVEVDYIPSAAVLDLEAAAADPPICALELGETSVEAALATADRVIEGTYRTGYQEHIYIECQAMTAWFDGDGRLEVVGSMQCPYYVHRSLMHAFGLPEDAVRVRASTVGGGFGGKEDYPSLIAIHAALLARAAGRPVRLAYDRHEDIVGTTKRHPARTTIAAGIDGEGRLVALDIDVTMDGGAFTTLSPVVLSRALLHASGPYRCPRTRVRGRVLRTHTAPNGAFRGFGAPQTQFAIERHIDRVAAEVGLDPWEIRWRNALRPGDRLPTGQVLDESTAARRCLEEVEKRTDFRRRWKNLVDAPAGAGERRGLGLSLFFHGAGFTGNGERRMRSPVRAQLAEDGAVEVLTAVTDMGQGAAAVFPQIACEAGGLAPEDVRFPEPDTDVVPDSGPTVASRTTMVVGGTVQRVVVELVERLTDWWRQERGLTSRPRVVDSTVVANGSEWSFREVARLYLEANGALAIERRHEPPAWQEFDESSYRGSAYPTYGWGADVVEVAVDTATLEVRATEVTSVCDVGRAIHPILCKGQIEGGTVQAVGWALMEEVKLEEGRYLNDRLATYIIPTIADTPRVDVVLLEQPWEGGPFGAKGVGELPMDGGAPAAAAAIEVATGLFVDTIPATPERLLRLRRDSDGDDGWEGS